MSTRQKTIPCTIIRGGTSRGLYFQRGDLPADESIRDQVLLQIMGGPDALQIDGIGGGHPLNNKVAIVGPSTRDDADVDYLFLQVVPIDGRVSAGQNCGNLLAGVGPYAIETGMIDADSPRTKVRVHMLNTGSCSMLTVETPNGIVNYSGDTAIAGVPGTGSPIICDFPDVAGSVCGSLLPTGNVRDKIDGLDLTCIDNGMPVVLVRAENFGIKGYESPDELDANRELKARIESLRRKVGPMMNLGDVEEKTVPKMCLVAAPQGTGHISTRTFIPRVCHQSIGVLGAVTVATACTLPGSVANGVARLPDGQQEAIIIEHASGTMSVRIVVGPQGIESAGVIRTARIIFRGEACVSADLLSEQKQD